MVTGQRRVVVLGAGSGALLTALALADGGHDVVVLERDAPPPPGDDESAWDDWDRRGVTQFRQPHALGGRVHGLLAELAPDVARMVEARGYACDLAAGVPDAASLTADDRRFTVRSIRRPTLERALAEAADRHPGVEVRRGRAVTGLVLGASRLEGRTHVDGVELEGGDVVLGDLVVDVLGRRTPVGGWLEEAGVPVEAVSESDGFTYFSRWYRHDGEPPARLGSLFGGLAPGLAALLFPGDADTVGVAMVGLGSDRALRRLRSAEVFRRTVAEFHAIAPWVDPDRAVPLTDVIPMGAIQNRALRLRTADTMGATGIVNTSDAGVSTNPSLGRGLSIAADLAERLRALLAADPAPGALEDEWDRIHLERHRPWLDDSVDADASLRSRFAAMVEGRPSGPPRNPDRAALVAAASVDMDCWRAWMSLNQVFDVPAAFFADDELMERARRSAAEIGPPPMSMTRTELDALLAA